MVTNWISPWPSVLASQLYSCQQRQHSVLVRNSVKHHLKERPFQYGLGTTMHLSVIWKNKWLNNSDTQKSHIRRAKQTWIQFEVLNSENCETTSIAADPKTFRKSITLIFDDDLNVLLPNYNPNNPVGSDLDTVHLWAIFYIISSIFNWSLCFRDGDRFESYDEVENPFNIDQGAWRSHMYGVNNFFFYRSEIIHSVTRKASGTMNLMHSKISHRRCGIWMICNFICLFQIYLLLSAHSSQATYEEIYLSIKKWCPASTMLLFDQVHNQLKRITGILPLHFDICVNTCLAYTSTFSTLMECLFCGEHWYEKHHDIDPKVPHCQFITLPLGPQMQAL